MIKSTEIIIGILLSIALALFAPNIPLVSNSIGIIGWLIIFTVLITLTILINNYLKSKDEKDKLEEAIKKTREELKQNVKEIEFLKERFKTLEDLSKIKVELEYLKRTKNERHK